MKEKDASAGVVFPVFGQSSGKNTVLRRIFPISIKSITNYKYDQLSDKRLNFCKNSACSAQIRELLQY